MITAAILLVIACGLGVIGLNGPARLFLLLAGVALCVKLLP